MVCERNCQLFHWCSYTAGIISNHLATDMCAAHSILSLSIYWKTEGIVTIAIHSSLVAIVLYNDRGHTGHVGWPSVSQDLSERSCHGGVQLN